MKLWCKGPIFLVFKQIWVSTGLLGCLTVSSLELFQVLLASENNNFDLWHFFVDHSFNETKPKKSQQRIKPTTPTTSLRMKNSPPTILNPIFFAELILWNVFFRFDWESKCVWRLPSCCCCCCCCCWLEAVVDVVGAAALVVVVVELFIKVSLQ